ncbi:hypothetical protein [Veillonella sp. 3310]|uniref:hypothetical protein n=1 Tax=Veillonella sp. 3310 TaxID=2490956 RepID=UPI000FD64A91|nr:hypothetical protein [Veillonella sp. 3310]
MTKGEERAVILKNCKQKTKMCLLTVPKKLKDLVAKVSNGIPGTQAVIIAMCEYLDDENSNTSNSADVELRAMIEWEIAEEKTRYTIRLPISLVEEFFSYNPEKTSTVKYNEALWGYVLRRS